MSGAGSPLPCRRQLHHANNFLVARGDLRLAQSVPALIRWLNEIDSTHVAVAGGKGASLGELVRAGAPVPPAFIVTSAAFEAFMGVGRSGGPRSRDCRTSRLGNP